MKFQDVQMNVATTNVTVTTTTETVAVSAGRTGMTLATARVLILAWYQMTSGTAATTITPRIRRGTATSGTLVGEANACILQGAAGNGEQGLIIATEERAGLESMDYSLTVAQASATGDGTVLQAGIVVFVL